MATRLPHITHVHCLTKTRIFTVEEVALTFANGAARRYERLRCPARGAVMIIARPTPHEVLLIREYAVGFERYEITLPQGAIDKGETLLQAAARELREECGVGARQLAPLCQLSLAPGYMDHVIQVVIAQDLYPVCDQGDEPEPLAVIRRSTADLETLIEREAIQDSRVIAALYRAQARQQTIS